MREIIFGSVAKLYLARETLIPNANYRQDGNQAQTLHSIDCLAAYFEETCRSCNTPPPQDITNKSVTIAPEVTL